MEQTTGMAQRPRWCRTHRHWSAPPAELEVLRQPVWQRREPCPVSVELRFVTVPMVDPMVKLVEQGQEAVRRQVPTTAWAVVLELRTAELVVEAVTTVHSVSAEVHTQLAAQVVRESSCCHSWRSLCRHLRPQSVRPPTALLPRTPSHSIWQLMRQH